MRAKEKAARWENTKAAAGKDVTTVNPVSTSIVPQNSGIVESKSRFIYVDGVMRELCICKSYAYRIINALNKELDAMGKFTIGGRVLRAYYEARTGVSEEDIASMKGKKFVY